MLSPTATGHSVNYRSVVVMAKAEQIVDPQDKLAAMRDFVEYVIRGRWAEVRPPTEQEKWYVRAQRCRDFQQPGQRNAPAGQTQHSHHSSRCVA